MIGQILYHVPRIQNDYAAFPRGYMSFVVTSGFSLRQSHDLSHVTKCISSVLR